MKITFLKTALLTLGLSLFLSCQEENPDVNTSEVQLNQKNLNKKGESHLTFNTDARMATIYALQYAQAAINPEFSLEPDSEQSPIFISGEEALEYLNPYLLTMYEKEEVEFMIAQLQRPGSRAVLMQNVPKYESNITVNSIYIPYTLDQETPEYFRNRFGGFFTDDPDPCDWSWTQVGSIGGNGCFCHMIATCFWTGGSCWPCPDDYGDFENILDKLRIPVEAYDLLNENFAYPIDIQELPLGSGLLGGRAVNGF